jgi:hypothetical protein
VRNVFLLRSSADANVGKVIMVDPYTAQVIANVYSQTEVLEKEFYLIEQLGSAHEPMPHLKAAIFVRPSDTNFALLTRELADPKFKGTTSFACIMVLSEI